VIEEGISSEGGCYEALTISTALSPISFGFDPASMAF
jgi:hypothetical protein